MKDAVLYEVRDRVAIITFDRPDRLNAWGPEIHQGDFTALGRAAGDPDVRVIVVTGSGRGWCAGADMDVLRGMGVAGGFRLEVREGWRASSRSGHRTSSLSSAEPRSPC